MTVLIKRVQTRRVRGKAYYTVRLVKRERSNRRTRERTILNLGRYYHVPKEDWRELAKRVREKVDGQQRLEGITYRPDLDHEAEYLLRRIKQRERRLARSRSGVDAGSLGATG